MVVAEAGSRRMYSIPSNSRIGLPEFIAERARVVSLFGGRLDGSVRCQISFPWRFAVEKAVSGSSCVVCT